MYRVIVIDDEPWTLLGIRNAFDWAAYHFEIISECTDAEEAFEIIRKERPDVVFTDIRMPKFNGIELMRMTRELDIDTEFVVISGYAEFTYVQEALKYGALDYFLKPINPETTDKLLEKVSKHIRSKQSIKGNLLMEALTGKNDSELHRLDPDFFCLEPCYWNAVIAYTNERDFSLQARLPENQKCLEISMNSGKKLYIIKSEQETLNGIQPLEPALEPGLTSVGISGRYGTMENIPKLIKEADVAALQSFVSDGNGIFYYKDEKRWIKPLLAKLQNELENNSFDNINGLLGIIRKEFIERKSGMNEAVYFWNQVIGIIMNHYKDEEHMEGLEYLNYLELGGRFKDFSSMLSFISEVFHQFDHKNNIPINPNEMAYYFDQLVRYIDLHYDEELYIKDLSERFYLNQFTCCKLFKKLLGKTFSEYVMDVRISKACQLIKNTDMTIEEIALKVGYTDYFYFNKVFKKHCGITPAKYKRN